MSSIDKDSLFFWLEQEPVECNADIYMPPDTPIQHQLPKISFQIKKKQELRKTRAIERLKQYHFEELEDLRESFSKVVIPSKLPDYNKHQILFDYIPTDKYLQDNIQELTSLIGDIDKIKPNGDHVTLYTPNTVPLTEEEEKEIKVSAEFKQDYKQAVEESFMDQEKAARNRYYSLVEELKQNKENVHPYVSIDPTATTTATTIPLPSMIK